jgi:hypothetical protein
VLKAKEYAGANSSGYRDDLKNHIRQQAWRTISHLFPQEEQEKVSSWLFDDNLDWKPLKIATAQLKIRWHENEQNYGAE